MSTKSHIYSHDNVEIFTETSEPVFKGTTFDGWNIYLCIEPIYPCALEINPKEDTIEISRIIGFPEDKITLPIQDVDIFEIDQDGVIVRIIGGSKSAKRMESKDFTFFSKP